MLHFLGERGIAQPEKKTVSVVLLKRDNWTGAQKTEKTDSDAFSITVYTSKGGEHGGYCRILQFTTKLL